MSTTIPPSLLARQGGRWLGAARHWMQFRFKNGSDVTWGSQDHLEGFPITVMDIEEVAALAAAEAMNEANAKHEREVATLRRHLTMLVNCVLYPTPIANAQTAAQEARFHLAITAPETLVSRSDTVNPKGEP